MAYNNAALEKYRQLVRDGEPFRSHTCLYCNGGRDAAVKHIDPKRKPQSPWDFWRNTVLSPLAKKKRTAQQQQQQQPVCVLGPMVDQSELPFRLLCRRYGATLVYSPMLHAKLFSMSASYRERYFTTTRTTSSVFPAEKRRGDDDDDDDDDEATEDETDHPLFVQFCGNDPETVLAAARRVEDDCEAVDLNLGCPQGIARRGHYGSFLMEDWDLIHRIVALPRGELRVPVTAKMRVFDNNNDSNNNDSGDEALTLKFAEMLRDAGVAVLCVHGRTRSMKGAHTGLANLHLIRHIEST